MQPRFGQHLRDTDFAHGRAGGLELLDQLAHEVWKLVDRHRRLHQSTGATFFDSREPTGNGGIAEVKRLRGVVLAQTTTTARELLLSKIQVTDVSGCDGKHRLRGVQLVLEFHFDSPIGHEPNQGNYYI